jgi:hypothetical protein
MVKVKNEGLKTCIQNPRRYLVTSDISKVTWHYRREQNSVVNTLTKAELESLFFTFVLSTYATSLCSLAHDLVAKVLTTGGGQQWRRWWAAVAMEKQGCRHHL